MVAEEVRIVSRRDSPEDNDNQTVNNNAQKETERENWDKNKLKCNVDKYMDDNLTKRREF